MLSDSSNFQRNERSTAPNNPQDPSEEASTTFSQSLLVRLPAEGFLGAFGEFGGANERIKPEQLEQEQRSSVPRVP